MRAEVKKAWVDALRSGKYKQGRGALRSGGNEYCCLGVLIDVLGIDWYPPSDSVMGDSYSIEDSFTYEPKLHPLDSSTLIMMNDEDEMSFAEIADYIEENA